MRLSPVSLIIFFGSITQAAAQPGVVKIPGLGFAWDGGSSQIRPIHGIPGAAILGDGPGKTDYVSVVISPRNDMALAICNGSGKIHAIRLSSGDVQDIPGVDASPERLIFSPSGAAALALGSKLQILTGLQDSFTVQDVALPPYTGTPTTIAVSDDAQLVLFSARSDDTPTTWLLAPGMSPFQVAAPGPIAVASFQPGTRDAVAVTPDGTVYRILNSATPGNVRQLYASLSQAADPVAVRVSVDGQRIYTVNRRGTAAVIDLSSASVEAVDCGCTPTGIEPLALNNIFRITEISGHPVMLFDVSISTPRIWFVPSDAPSVANQRSAQ